MANFLINSSSRTRRSRSRTMIRGTKKKSDSENSATLGQCKKHPKHRQSPGVCSLCLNDKLSKLSLEYYDYTSSSRDPETVSSCSSSSSSLSSSYYSSVSTCLSPLHHRYSEIVAKKKDAKKQGFLFRLLLG